MKLDLCRMEFSGKLLKRGFWLYIWDIKGQIDKTRHLYVGRTGDSSSANASSPFRRIGQHLDTKLNARGNALGRQLKAAGLDAETCTFEMVAIGPIFEEQKTLAEHYPLRDKAAALESALAEELRNRGYEVLGHHPRSTNPDPDLLKELTSALQRDFPSQPKFQVTAPRFHLFDSAEKASRPRRFFFAIEKGSKSSISLTPGPC